jgi:hypothetical protein
MRVVCLLAAVAAALAGAGTADAGWRGDEATARAGLARAVAGHRLAELEAREYRRDLALAARTIRSSGSGARPVAAALSDVAAHWRRYDRPRALALFTMLRLNTKLYNKGSLPRFGRTTADADGVAYRAVARGGARFHPLASFGNLNRVAAERDYRATVRLVYALLARARSVGGALVWEYDYRAAGGSAPWSSGLAQAVAAQALARAGFLPAARRAYNAIPRRLLLRLENGPWIRLYSFSGAAVLNAQLQAAVSLEEYGRRVGDRGARRLASRLRATAAELLPRFDTGSWSLYALRGNESTLGYHTYVTSLLWKLARRTGEERWARWAARLRDQWRKPPEIRPGPRTRPAMPVPADGFRDWAEIRFRLSKPATVTLSVAGERIVRRFEAGDRSIWWRPGRRRSGTYDVRIHAVDRVGNASRRRLPPVRLERDTEPPRLAAALSGPKLSWRARDAGTPWLSMRVVLRRGGAVIEHRLPRANLRGTRPVPLDTTTRWHVTVVAADSSGNWSRVVLGQVGGPSRLPL